jgi:hypothetical protein
MIGAAAEASDASAEVVGVRSDEVFSGEAAVVAAPIGAFGATAVVVVVEGCCISLDTTEPMQEKSTALPKIAAERERTLGKLLPQFKTNTRKCVRGLLWKGSLGLCNGTRPKVQTAQGRARRRR